MSSILAAMYVKRVLATVTSKLNYYSQAEYWHFGAEPCIVKLQSFFCIFE